MDEICRTVTAEEEGIRMDAFLSTLSGLTRSKVQHLLEQNLVFLNGAVPAKAGVRLRAGDRLRLCLPEPEPVQATATEMELDVVYEDAQMLVVNKPRGLVVHPAAGHWEDTLVNGLLFRQESLSGLGGELRPGIVHRLDKDTTGLLVVAKTDQAHQALAAQIAEHSARREYLALVEGGFSCEEGAVDQPIGRDPRDRKKMAVVPGGRQAKTHYRVEQRFDRCSLLRLVLETGRTHQIRVHMRHLGHPVCGDPIYGFAKSGAGPCPLMLHAQRLRLRHPVTGEALCFETPPPQDFLRVLERQRPR